ncbi:MAG: hypothetical protein EOP51_12775 [Sphingobacteriales bacterium]|nr:MAG: hypothetical protein EOP51_12775 [Sphingobacteriales bacterium]
MMTINKSLLVAAALLLCTAAESNAQIYVNIRPARPTVVINRPAMPAPGYVWVEEDWAPRGNEYAWHGGYWAAPPRARAIWVPGYWEERHGGGHGRGHGRGHYKARGRGHGYVWVPGRWR